MIQATHRAGRHLRRDFGEILQISPRSADAFAHAAVQKVTTTLEKNLKSAHPHYSFVPQTDTPRWHITPLDGFVNFLHGLPYFAIALALEEEDKTTASLVYNPVTDEMFAASRGHGAFLNKHRIRVAQRRRPRTRPVGSGRAENTNGSPVYSPLHRSALARLGLCGIGAHGRFFGKFWPPKNRPRMFVGARSRWACQL